MEPPSSGITTTEGRRKLHALAVSVGGDIASSPSPVLAPFKVGGAFPARVVFFPGPSGAWNGAVRSLFKLKRLSISVTQMLRCVAWIPG